MKEEIEKLRETALKELKKIDNSNKLEEFRIKYLGKKSQLQNFLKQIGSLPNDQKPIIGKLVNIVKKDINTAFNKLKSKILAREKKARRNVPDPTLPGIDFPIGHSHILNQTINDVCKTFINLGFEIKLGPELETDFYNFEALNIPADHPAREDFDSFYSESGKLLRTHTSPVQIRTMLKEQPPIAMVCPGKCYRRDAVDATHYPMFYQIEGLMVDENITLGDLKGILTSFCHRTFGSHTEIRFRPSFFPFTEPSAEVDISCVFCGGKGCKVCKNSGWLEILGSGMVDPEVFRAVDYDPEKWTGFAFGMGVERVAMLKYNIQDIRIFYDNDLEFLEQF